MRDHLVADRAAAALVLTAARSGLLARVGLRPASSRLPGVQRAREIGNAGVAVLLVASVALGLCRARTRRRPARA